MPEVAAMIEIGIERDEDLGRGPVEEHLSNAMVSRMVSISA